MLVAAAGFTTVPITVHYLATRLPVVEIIFLRNLTALLPMLFVIKRSGFGVLRTNQLGGHAWRALFTYGAMLTYFLGISVVPLADATAIQFLIPIFAAIGGILLLGEHLTWSRSLATIAGLSGALLIIRPGLTEVSIYTVAIIASAGFYAASWLMVKHLAAADSPSVIVLYLNLLLLPLSVLPAWLAWAPLTIDDLLPLLILGLGGWVAHFAQAKAFGYGDVGVLAPMDFLRLPLVALAAYLFFDQIPPRFVWLGGAIIVAAASYLAQVEQNKQRER